MAQTDMFLKLEGIKGESKDKAHKDEIDIYGWDWSMDNSGSMHTGTGGGVGKVAVNDVVIYKRADRATAELLKRCCAGEHVTKATLSVRKSGGSAPVDYVVITMDKVVISHVGVGAQQDPLVNEQVRLNFAKVKVEYQPQKDDGAKDGGAISMSWNVRENTKD